MCNFPRAKAKKLHHIILEDILELSFNIFRYQLFRNAPSL